MQLLRLTDVPILAADRVFRYSVVRALCGVFILLGCAAALIVFGWRAHSYVFYAIAAFLLVSLLLMRRLILARMRPSNWLVRMNELGVYVQFRLYANYHLSADDITVAFFPYSEIRSVQLVRERSQIPDNYHEVTTQYRRLVALRLTCDYAALEKAVSDEIARPAPPEKRWYGTTSMLYRNYPVHCVAPDIAQIEWAVVPGPRAFFNALHAHTTIAAPVAVSKDFTNLKSMTHAEQIQRLRELIDRGETIAATAITRELFGYNLTQAHTYIERLRNGSA